MGCRTNKADGTTITHYGTGQLNYSSNSGVLSATVDGQTTQFFVTNNSTALNEYHITVQNPEGGQTVYERKADAGAGYTVRQIDTDEAGNTTLDFSGHQAGLMAGINPVSLTEKLNGIETGSFYGSDGAVTGRSKTLIDAGGASTSDTLANTLQSLRDATGDLDEAVLAAAELRTLNGSQAEGEAWGGGRLLVLGDSTLADYYRHHQDIQTGAAMPLLLDDPQTQGLNLLGGFDLGNGASVLLDSSGDIPASWNYIHTSPSGIDYNDWDYDTGVVDYSYDANAYSYSSYTYDSYDYGAYNYGSYDYGWSSWWPVALDMDGDGIELVTQADSHAWYDVQGDGYRRNIGWVGSDDALLAIDENHDGKITNARELSFAMWTADTTDTDLQALKASFDTNHDQKLDAQDTLFADLRVWQDKNGDGVSDAGELKTLAEVGIKSIGLSVAQTDWSSGGNRVAGFATYEMTNGTRGWAADVGLGYDTQGWKASVESNLVRMTESGGLVYGIARNNALNLDLGTQGLDGAIGGTSSDTLAAGSKKAVLLEGGAGDDKLTGGAGDDWLAGDAGADTLSGGDGDDTLLIDAQDTQINLNGGAGFDMAVVTGSAAVSLDLGAAGIEAAVGGAGNDNLRTSGTARVILAGGSGSDSLSGSATGDLLYGGTGDDALKGGRGNDIYVFNRGDGADTITDAATTMATTITTRFEYYLVPVLAGPVIGNASYQQTLDQAVNTLSTWTEPVGSSLYSQALSMVLGSGSYWQYTTATRTIQTSSTTEVEVDAGQDILRFGVGVGQENLMRTVSGADWIFSISQNGVVNGDRITLKNQTNSKARIEFVEFSDGQKYAMEDLVFGTAGSDVLTGTATANVMNGGAGGDTLRGGAGNDVYIVDHAGDSPLENANEGIDMVLSSISFGLGSNIEDLVLTGTAAIDGSGNNQHNVITGNSAANTLDGGAGNDSLDGGMGDDRYRFNLGGGQDTVTDASGSDRIVFGPGIKASQITASMVSGQVKLAVATGDSVSFAAPAFNNYAIEQFEFADSSVKDSAWLNGLLNIAPTGLNKTLSLNEDGSYAITAADLGFSDATPGDSLSAVRIDTLPGAGSLKLNGTAVTAAQVVSAADLAAGRLVFAPAANANGSNYASLNFSVKDQYGAFDAAPNTLTFNVTPVDDAPALTGAKAVLSAGTEDTAYAITQASLLAGFSDVDGNSLAVVNLSATNGTDLVQSYIASYTLSANVENLSLAGAAAISGVGNGLDNFIAGNSGANILNGGFGNDTLAGGAGDDLMDQAPSTLIKVVVLSGTEAQLSVVGNAATGKMAISGGWLPSAHAGQSLQVLGSSSVDKVFVTAGSSADTVNLGSSTDEIYLTGRLSDYATTYAGSVITLTRQSGLAAGQVEVVKLLGSTLADNVYFNDGFIKTSAMINALKSGTAVALDTSQRTDMLLAIPAVLSEGADTMAGGTGNDTFMVDDAADVVTELAGEGTDTVQSYLANYTLSANVENLTLLGNLNAGGTGNALANVLSGNAGNNTLAGSAGGDSYLAYRGMGQDRIVENDSTAGNTDMLSFSTGIANDQLWFRQAGNDLEVSVIGTADKATVQNWYLGDSYRVEQIKSGDGKALQHTDVDKLVSAMAGFAPPAMGETILTASQQAALAPVLAANWH